MRIHAPAILYFDAVRRAGSIREGARQLNVASSAVNRQILKLEDEIGVALFERRSDGVVLTTAGEMLARHVIVVLQDLERAKSDIAALRGARVGHVTVAAVEGVSAALLPKVIGRLNVVAPRIRVTALTMGSRDIPDAIEDGTADVGIAFSIGKSPRIRQVHMAKFKLGAIMAPTHPLVDRETVSILACTDYPLVWAGASLSIAPILELHLQSQGRAIEPAVITDSIDLMRQLTLSPPMIGFQSPIGLEDLIAEGKIRHIPLETARGPIWSELGVYVRAGRSLPAAIDLFLQVLIAELQDKGD
ncbi:MULTISPECIES: LysR family transcriptional regulator [Pacificibacter]|uniref:LysR family transcriptional regulator n=1 Tax=Pacificibacter TaxID=1042323 RepID=UPI001C0A27CA|nr:MULTISPECIES: LysR substrate-binding domain-containing protein [Pacificibacter]MBU2935150.1 LysR family transcriptional regulator [Pacificibacter marinus]MDO6615941.1 LysR substrate-binding domain-containing protein [Pacificibacter sp. 1_MG-2023]